MKAAVEQLFHTLADLSPEARAQYLAERAVDAETLREVGALLAFDTGASTSLLPDISIAAGRALPQLGGKGWRCGPRRARGRRSVRVHPPPRIRRLPPRPATLARAKAPTVTPVFRARG